MVPLLESTVADLFYHYNKVFAVEAALLQFLLYKGNKTNKRFINDPCLVFC